MALVAVLYWSIRATIGVFWCGKHVPVHWDHSERLFLQKSQKFGPPREYSGPNFWLFCKNSIDENWQCYQFYSYKKVRNLAPVGIMTKFVVYWKFNLTIAKLPDLTEIWPRTSSHPYTLRVCPEKVFTGVRPNTIDFATCHRTHQDHNMDTWMIGRKT